MREAPSGGLPSLVNIIAQLFLANHPRFHLHFTPTSASWLNAVESWFSQLERPSLYRGVFTSVGALRQELRRYIQEHTKHSAKPFVWAKSAETILESVKRTQKIRMK